MVFVAVAFGLLGVLLILVGVWGARRTDRLAVVPGWDQRSIERRSGTLRRGAYACVIAGAVFIVLATLSLVFMPDTSNCPPGSTQCSVECIATKHCVNPPAKR